MCSKISQRLWVIGRIRNCLPQQTAQMLVESMVVPLFDYGDVIWSNCSSTTLTRLQRLQNRAGRLILKCPKRTPSVEVRRRLKWQDLNERHNFHLASMVYKCYTGSVPPYLLNCFTPLNSVHSHNTRLSKANGVFINHASHRSATRKFVHRGSVLWNRLPQHLKQAADFKSFKAKYRSYFWVDHPRGQIS